ncbi:hypothetical protein CAEBREN_00179 [Caenorhabditis brenneri]|uniref:Uncharacterized protein n=1 Tax=Caenorhabditis brenneri TaxID=135651 RepID=G0NB86_CAEBE|nr:hypothetical protein CAEBREN_00179 [Caenorhabditis brenneri]
MPAAFVNKIQLSGELIHQLEAFGKLLIDPKKFTITNFIPTGDKKKDKELEVRD